MVNKTEQFLTDEMLEIMLSETIDSTLDRYEISRLPKTNLLSACLEVYTKEYLFTLAEDNGVAVKRSWRKARIVVHLHHHIMDTIEERVFLLDESKFELLHKFVHDELEAGTFNSEETEFYIKVYPILVQMGLLFSMDTKEGTAVVTAAELKHVVKEMDQVKEKHREKINFAKQIKEVLKAAIHLYGTIDSQRVIELWKINYPDFKYTVEFYEYLSSILPIIIIQNNYYFTDQNVIGSSKFENTEEALHFHFQRLDKMANDYYVPTKKDVQYYGKHSFNRKSSVYKKLKQLVSKCSDDVQLAMNLLEYYLIFGISISVVMIELEEYELLAFATKKQAENFFELYIQLHNDTRMWGNGGYKPSEMGAQETDTTEAFEEFNTFSNIRGNKNDDHLIPLASYQNTKAGNQQPTRVNKVGRNDPCPCGSGKKYKKCCMKGN